MVFVFATHFPAFVVHFAIFRDALALGLTALVMVLVSPKQPRVSAQWAGLEWVARHPIVLEAALIAVYVTVLSRRLLRELQRALDGNRLQLPLLAWRPIPSQLRNLCL